MAKLNFKKGVSDSVGNMFYKSSYMTVKVHGLKELDDALNSLELQVRKRIMKKAGKAAMAPVLTRIKTNLRQSEDTGGLYGTARMSTSFNTKKLRKTGRKSAMVVSVSAGQARKSPQGFSGHQALQLEFGTEDTQAQPFIRPAIQGKERRVIKHFGKHLKVGLERQAKKEARRTARAKTNKGKK